MDWPEELLEIFDDPLLADVRPKPKAPTPDDRLAQKLLEINKWVAEHGSEPTADGGLKEKLLAASLKALRTKATDSLRQYDEYHLLGYAIILLAVEIFHKVKKSQPNRQTSQYFFHLIIYIVIWILIKN